MYIKRCCTCKLEQDIENFSFKYKESNVRSSECKVCHKAYNNKWYLDNKERVKDNVKRNKTQYIEFFKELKNNKPCLDCAITYPYFVLDYDHVRGEKSFDISMAIAQGYPKSDILKEIKKCELVCSNCHRFRTAKRLGFL